MRYHQLIVLIRSSYPNNKFLRRELAKIRVKIIKSHMISDTLIEKCEHKTKEKNTLVKKYMKKWHRYLQPDINKIHKLMCVGASGINKSSFYDVIFCRLAYGFAPEEYVTFSLMNKSSEQRRSYISDLDRFCYVYQMNDISDLQQFNDKIKTYNMFGKYYKRETVKVENRKDLKPFLQFVENHSLFVKKDALESVGRSIELIDVNKLNESPEEYFYSLMKKGKFIIEEKIEQSPELSNFNHSSINTIRCIAIKTRNDIVTPYCFIKFGRNGSFVDNAGAGGIVAGIDVSTGIINTDGYDRNYVVYSEHPDTGVTFKGFQLPDWDDMLRIVKEMSSQLETVKYVGWDLAYSLRGWCVVEGNGMSQLIAPQFIYKHGIKQEMLDYMNNMDLFF